MGRLLALVLTVLGGPAAEQPDGTLVLGVVGNERSASAVHGERAMVADPRTGSTHTRTLAGGTLCHGPLMAAGDRVLYAGYRGRRAVAMTLPLTLAGRPSSLGDADSIAPSPNPGHVWLGRWRHGRERSRVALREVAVDGGGVAARAGGVLPRWSHTGLATPEGLGMARAIGRGAPLAADGARMASCAGRCRGLALWTARGRTRIAAPPGVRPLGSEGAFSPDGRRLALAVTRAGRQRAAIVDLAAGRWTLVPGGPMRNYYGAVAWSPTGRWLYFAGPDRGLYAWQPGAADAVRLPIDAHGTVLSIAVAG